MHEGRIEPTRYPRNPLDVLAQQIVAMVAVDSWRVEDLFATVRKAAPFAELSRTMFDGILDMLSGLYPSDEFAELRPRLTWDRVAGTLTSREGSKRIAITSGGTIPDRGLYGVFLAGAEKSQPARVGELDEEMVFESSPGDTFMLGASTWRIEEITHDRVLVTPAPGETGKMPFWKADAAERSVPFGREIGRLVREVRAADPEAAIDRLVRRHDLDRTAAENFLQYLRDQHDAAGAVPDDRTIVIERVTDELGDWRVCVLTPFGGRVHAPWAMAVTAMVRNEMAIDVETMWSDDGFIVRFPESGEPPRAGLLLPEPDEVEQLVIRQLGSSSMFAARFREAAARALLLPRTRIRGRTPLWQQRKRAYDLLQVASRFGSFPIILEAYRETLRDSFDVPALVDITTRIRKRDIRVHVADTQKPSPFASSVLFRYVANFLYDGDAPLAERRAQALSIDQSQLRQLLGEPELRDLLDAEALTQTEIELQRLTPDRHARSADGLHDLLIRLGDLTDEEIAARFSGDAGPVVRELERQRRVVAITVSRERRYIAVEDVARYRDAVGVPPPQGLAERYLEPVADAIGDLVLRYARTHGPFTPSDVAARYGMGVSIVFATLERFVERGRIIEGEFRPSGTQREWCDAEVLRLIRRRSLARLRKEVEPVDPPVLARLFTRWQGVNRPRRGLEGLLEVIETLQGAPIAASLLETEVLPARIDGYRPSDLDTLSAAGEIIWVGLEPVGERDGRIALYLTDHLPLLRAPNPDRTTDHPVVSHLRNHGASFFAQIQAAVGGFPAELVDTMWDLVWKGAITNDTFQALRAYVKPKTSRPAGYRSRRTAPASTTGRWSLIPEPAGTSTAHANALAGQLLARYGVVTREVPANENIAGGFGAVYPVLKAMEDAGRVRRGYFVSGLGATQFATPGALDLLRSLREPEEEAEIAVLAASDPANPYGSILRWPGVPSGTQFSRSVGVRVILVDGILAAYLARGQKQMFTFLPEDEPQRSRVGRAVARALASFVDQGRQRALLLSEVNGERAATSAIAPFLIDVGFVAGGMGLQKVARKP
jgi:ATP-dependent Lhr-like helicase